MQAVILNRLLSARFLLENSGRHLNRHSDSRAVAHGVLMAHDAAELTLGAIAEELQLSLAEKVTFPELTKAINDKFIVLHAANTSKFPSGLSGQLYLNKLNKVRVAFKHHGELPNVGSWFEVMD